MAISGILSSQNHYNQRASGFWPTSFFVTQLLGPLRAIFGYGLKDGYPPQTTITNLVSNTGVVATDTAGVGTARYGLAASRYGTNKAIFGYGYNGSDLSITNLISSTGVVANDTTGVGTGRSALAAAGFSS
jgi:hypothetical protein